MTTGRIGLIEVPEDHQGHAHHAQGGSKASFALHFVEMMVSMGIGMGVGGALGVNSVENTELKAALWLIAMAVPMVGWMRFRGMSWRYGVEMSLGMAIPTALALPAFWTGALPAKGLIGIEHMSMVPGTLAVMLYRRKGYGW